MQLSSVLCLTMTVAVGLVSGARYGSGGMSAMGMGGGWNMNSLNMNNGMNGLNMNAALNGLNMNMNNGMNGLNMNALNMNNAMGRLNALNMNMNGLNMNRNNGLNSMNALNMNGLGMMSMLGGGMNNGLNMNALNMNAGRADDGHNPSEGVFDDASASMADLSAASSMTSLMAEMSGGAASMSDIGMTKTYGSMSPLDDASVSLPATDDPGESHVVVSSGDDVMMIRNPDV